MFLLFFPLSLSLAHCLFLPFVCRSIFVQCRNRWVQVWTDLWEIQNCIAMHKHKSMCIVCTHQVCVTIFCSGKYKNNEWALAWIAIASQNRQINIYVFTGSRARDIFVERDQCSSIHFTQVLAGSWTKSTHTYTYIGSVHIWLCSGVSWKFQQTFMFARISENNKFWCECYRL